MVGIVKPENDGGVPFIRDTGAVWFTLTAKTVDWDALELSDWDCVTPVVELVADVALWTASGGAAGVAINGLKMAAKEGSKAALKAGLKAITKESAKKAGKYVAFGTLAGLHQEVYTSVKADFENTGKIRESSLGGQYAGYAWPFRCDAMPTYEVRGGPNREDPTFTEGSELKIVKIDDCGIKMMN